jgi:uncharacterized SAM-binding protein YcdF (DUF218 family)
MFIFLSKLLPMFVYPVGLIAILIAISLLIWKRPKLAKSTIILAFIVLLLSGNRYTAFSLARSLEWKNLPTAVPQNADSIVILGGATEPFIAPRPSVEINGAGDRIIYGAILFHRFQNIPIIVSGGDIDFLDLGESTPASDMSDLLGLLGVPRESILVQGNSQNTYEDALYTCKMLKEKGFEHTLLVTSATHMPRALAVFEKQGCQMIPAPTDFTVTVEAWNQLWHPNAEQLILNLVPSYSNISLITKTLKEYIGLWVYQLKGYA